MGHQGDGGSLAIAARKHADHILVVATFDVERLRVEAVGDGLARLDVDLQPEALAARDEVVAHPIVLERAGGMRPDPDRLHVGEGAGRGELEGRRVGRQRGRGPASHPRQRAREDEARDQGCGSKHARGFPRSANSPGQREP